MRESLLSDGWNPDRVRYIDLPWTPLLDENLPGPSGDTDRVVYFGRLAPEKGVDRLLRAWPLVLQERSSAELAIWGDGAEGARLQAMCEELKIPSVEFCGRYQRGEISSILSGASLTIHPSAWAENSPFTVRESLMCGVPVVVTPRGGLPEMVPPGCGKVAEDISPEALAQAILSELDARRSDGRSRVLEAVQHRAISEDEHVEAVVGLMSDVIKAAGGR